MTLCVYIGMFFPRLLVSHSHSHFPSSRSKAWVDSVKAINATITAHQLLQRRGSSLEVNGNAETLQNTQTKSAVYFFNIFLLWMLYENDIMVQAFRQIMQAWLFIIQTPGAKAL